MEYYCLYRVRTGSEKQGHEDHESYDNRFHLTEGERYNKGSKLSDRNALFDDKKTPQWIEWIKSNEYLGMGIPSTTEDQLNTSYVR